MRSEEIREDVELETDWTPKGLWRFPLSSPERRRGYRQRPVHWPRLIVLLVVTAPFGIIVLRFLNGLIQQWARDGLNVFEILVLLIAFWSLFSLYRWLIRLAR